MQGHRQRGPHLPRSLRGDPHHDDGALGARGRRRDQRAGRQAPAQLDALPHPTDGRARREDRGALRHPRREGLLRQLRVGGERDGVAPRIVLPQVEPSARVAQQLSRPLVRDDGRDRQPRVVAQQPQPVQRALRAQRLPAPLAVPKPRRRGLRRGLRGGPAQRHRDDHLRRRRDDDRRADPRRRWLLRAARRVLRRDEEGPRRVRDPLHLRRGADGVGPHRRALLGLRGARRRARRADVREGPWQRARDRGARRAWRPDGCDAGELALHVRRQPARHRGRDGEPPVPARQRPAGQRAARGLVPARAASSAGRPVRDGRRGARPRTDDRHRARRGGRAHAEPAARRRVPRSVQGRRCAGRQGRPLRQLLARRPAAVDLTRRGRRGRGGDRRRAARGFPARRAPTSSRRSPTTRGVGGDH